MNKLQNACFYIFSFGMLVFFLPVIFADAFGISKFLFLLVGVSILWLIWAYNVYQRDSLSWILSPFDLPVIGIGAVYLLSTLIASPNKIATLASPLGPGTVILLILFYFITIQTISASAKKITDFSKHPLILGMVHAAILLATWTLFNLALELTKTSFNIPINIAGIASVEFPLTPLSAIGNLLTQAVFFLIVLIFVGYKAFGKSKTTLQTLDVQEIKPAKNSKILTENLGPLFTFIIIFLGLLATGYKLNQTTPFPLLPFKYGWAIAIEAFKNAPVFGIGPANYLSAFTRFKPMNINNSNYWNTTFGLSSNFYLHLLTTVGWLGLTAYLFLIWKVLNVKNKAPQNILNIVYTVIGMFALQLLVPFNLPLLYIEFAFLSILGAKLAKPATRVRLVTEKKETPNIANNKE